MAMPFINSIDDYLFDYPTKIDDEPIRMHNNKPVSPGRLNLFLKHGNEHFPPMFEELRSWNGEVHALNKANYSIFKDILQCAKAEPLNENFHLLKLVPLTQYNLEIFCAWAETNCKVGAVDSNSCADIRLAILKSSYNLNNFENKMGYWDNRQFNGFQTPTMLRIYNETLYYDWPWLSRRLLNLKNYYDGRSDNLRPFYFISSYITDIGNSVFVMGNEWPALNLRIPMPYFSYATSTKMGDSGWPWQETWNYAYRVYKRVVLDKKTIEIPTFTEYSNRISKAAMYGSYDTWRNLIFEIGAQRPDLVDAHGVYIGHTTTGWNPSNSEKNLMDQDIIKYIQNNENSHEAGNVSVNHTGFGYPSSALPVIGLQAKNYAPSNYKYLIVPLGTDGMTTSGRLASYLIESNAVVLLQDGARELGYHFSGRLKPYVHFVPFSKNGADLVEKIEWLQRNDDLAYQIARNGQIFAQSYLRFEDLLCFAAYAVHQSSKYTTEEAKRPSKDPIPALKYNSYTV